MYQICKKYKFEMAHRLITSWSENCQEIHGHSYEMELLISAKKLNKDGMVMDFGEVKQIIDSVIGTWDHGIMISNGDPLRDVLKDYGPIIVDYNPTAENMSKDIAVSLSSRIFNSIPTAKKITVRIHETNSAWAEYTVCRKSKLKKEEN